MNKLTPIFIAGALAISGGLALAQSQMNDGNAMPGHNMSGMEMPADASPSTQAYTEAMDGMMKNMRCRCRLHARHDPPPSRRDRHGQGRARIRQGPGSPQACRRGDRGAGGRDRHDAEVACRSRPIVGPQCPRRHDIKGSWGRGCVAGKPSFFRTETRSSRSIHRRPCLIASSLSC